MNITSIENSRHISISLSKRLVGVSKNPTIRLLNSSGPSTFNIKDQIYTNYNNSITVYDYNLIPLIMNNDKNNIISWSSDNTNISSVNSDGYVSYVNDGSCNIIATMNGTSISTPIFNQAIRSSNTVFTSYANGSLAKHIWDNINSRVIQSPLKEKNIFSVQNHSSGTYERNINNLLSNIDLTCISPWNSNSANLMAGTLISPRHVLFCKHFNFYPSIGSTIRFVNSNNQIVNRSIQNILTINNTGYPDFVIGLLDSDATGISVCKVLPENWYNYLPSINRTNAPYSLNDSIPVVYTDYEEKSLVAHWHSHAFGTLSGYTISIADPSDINHKAFYETPITGDSGNPIFVIINNTLVLLSVFTTPNSGSFISNYISEINSIIGQHGYQLDIVNLSQFNTY